MLDGRVIQLKNISFAYDKQKIIDGVDLTVEKGDFLAILGPNGSGKTTLLKVLLGLLKPTSGEVTIFNEPIRIFKDYKKIGYVPQKATQFDHRFPATVEEIIKTSRFQKGFLAGLNQKDKIEIQRALSIVGLEGYEKRLIGRLSGGQQQRVFIAQAICNHPELLILDEPTNGLDCNSQSSLYDFLQSLNKEMGITLITVSHDVGVVYSKVSKIACLNKKLLFHGQPTDFDTKVLSNMYEDPAMTVIKHI